MAEESKTSSLVPAHNCFNAETFFLHDRGLILREAGVYLTLKELGNYLAMCQQVRRLMIGDERYVQRFWHAVGFKELGGVIAVHDHQWNVLVNVSCYSFHDIPVMKTFIKLLAQPELTEGCFVSLAGPVGRKGIAIQSECDRKHALKTFKKRRLNCLQYFLRETMYSKTALVSVVAYRTFLRG